MQRWLKAVVLLYLLLVFCGSFVWISILKSGMLDETAFFPPIIIFKTYQYYACAGAIGGSLYALRLFYWHNIRGVLHIEKWWIWYFLRPIMSAGTALMMVILFEGGMLSISLSKSEFATIGLSFLVGYGFGKVMDKLDGITETIFNGKPDAPHKPKEPNKTEGMKIHEPSDSSNPDK